MGDEVMSILLMSTLGDLRDGLAEIRRCCGAIAEKGNNQALGDAEMEKTLGQKRVLSLVPLVAIDDWQEASDDSLKSAV